MMPMEHYLSKKHTLLFYSHNSPASKWWHRMIWKWKIPMKLKCFTWLCLEDKILTWKNLLKRGFYEPSICLSCKEDFEDISHVFHHCQFYKRVWNELQSLLQLSDDWYGLSFNDCMLNWFMRKVKFKFLPIFTIWEIWKSGNKLSKEALGSMDGSIFF